MIHPEVLFEHIDIRHARNFVDISKTAQPNPRILYVLHEKGKVLKAWDSQKGKVILGPAIVASPEEAERLRLQFQVDEVQLIDRETFQRYLKEAHDLAKARELTGYEFKDWTRRLKDGMGNGFLIHPRREDYDYYHYVERTRRFVSEKLQPDCVLLIGAYEGKEWWVSGVLVFTGGLVTRVSTFETFPAVHLNDSSSTQTQQALLQTAAQTFRKTAFGLFITKETFEKYAQNQWRGLGQCPLLKAAL